MKSAYPASPALRSAQRLIALLILIIGCFVAWSLWFDVEQIARSTGQVIASSRTQLVQAANDGVIEKFLVREGGRVKKGDVLVMLEREQGLASLSDSRAKVAALKAALVRLHAEVLGRPLVFPPEVQQFPTFVSNQTELFQRRQRAVNQEAAALQSMLASTRDELSISEPLLKSGDISRVEIIRLQKQVAELEGQITNRRNKYFQDAQAEMTKAEEDLATQEQVLADRATTYERTEIRAPADATVRNIRFTTLGSRVKAGDVVMELTPSGSDLVVEGKFKPADIASIRVGQPAAVKLDAYDYATYTILAGQTDANGIAVAANSLALNSGSIKNTVGTDAALADNASLMVDTTVAAPVIGIVAGDDVTVTGTPQLALDIGGSTVQASYATGSGGTALAFTYTVVAGQTDANGIAVAANSLALNSGSIKNTVGTDATLAHAAVADNASFKVDTTGPTVASVALTGATGILNSTLNATDVVTATVSFSEAVTVTGTPRLALTIGSSTVQANYLSGSGSTALSFTYTILAGQTDANGIAVGASKLTLNGGTITDAAGNTATLTHSAVADNGSFMVDTTAPAAPTISTVAGNDIIDSTEAASAITVAGTAVAGASVALTLTTGQVRTVTADGTGAWSYSLVAADIGFMGQGSKTLSATQNDPAGNMSAAGTRAITVSTSGSTATVSSLAFGSTTGMLNSRLNAGDTVTTAVTFSEAVTVSGIPQLALVMGATPVQASYVSGSGTTVLLFTYTILAGQTDGNGLGVAANGLTLNTGSIKDGASHDVVLTHAAVGSNINYIVDTTAAAAPGIDIVAGDDVIDSAEAASVITGTAEANASVALTLGAGNVRTVTANGSGVWSYTLVAADIAAMGPGAEILSATQTDLAGNTSVAGTRPITVNATVAVASVTNVALSSAGAQNNLLTATDVVTAMVTFSEAVTLLVNTAVAVI